MSTWLLRRGMPFFWHQPEKKLEPGPSHRKDDAVRCELVFPLGITGCDLMGFPVHIGDGGTGVDVHLVPERVDEVSHGLKVGVGAEMLDLSLLHVQVILQTEPLEFIIGLEPLGGGSVLHHDAVRFLNVADYRFRREKVGEPAAVFGGDDIFAVRKGAGTSQTFHNGAGITLDALLDLTGYNGTDAVPDVPPRSIRQMDSSGAFSADGKRSQAADAAADDGNIILGTKTHDEVLLSLFPVSGKGKSWSSSGREAICFSRSL